MSVAWEFFLLLDRREGQTQSFSPAHQTHVRVLAFFYFSLSLSPARLSLCSATQPPSTPNSCEESRGRAGGSSSSSSPSSSAAYPHHQRTPFTAFRAHQRVPAPVAFHHEPWCVQSSIATAARRHQARQSRKECELFAARAEARKVCSTRLCRGNES